MLFSDMSLNGNHASAGAAGEKSSRKLTILFGTETGNCAYLATSAADSAGRLGLRATVADMADYEAASLENEEDLLILVSTHSEGEPPRDAKPFFEFISGGNAPRLTGKRFAVVALGDSLYEHFCDAGKRLDQRLEELGAARIADRVDCDIDYEESAGKAIGQVLSLLAPAGAAGKQVPRLPPVAAPAAPGYDKQHPFQAVVLDNYELTAPGTTREIRHVELSIEGSKISFEPGDALGVLPRNDPRLVESILECTGLAAEAPVVARGESSTLREALESKLEIVQPTPRLLDLVAGWSGSGELRLLLGEEQAKARTRFLREHDVIDVLRGFAVAGLGAQTLVAALRPLQPRLYSIASSPSAIHGEVHLTVAIIRYELHGESRIGVASGHFVERGMPGSFVPAYVQSNPHFRLPDDDVPILMIGAGTGIAPYRAFLQEREARGAPAKNWLLFGARHARTDFLYQSEWEQWLKSGLLTRMDVAFSRDQTPKVYLQQRLFDHVQEVYAWLEAGAHVYVCGDASRFAPNIHAALRSVIEIGGSLRQAEAEEYLAALQREHRYHTDVY